jgi:hypothetical protein
MPIRIKNWSKFQHFKDRRPPWVKLYRDLLDDMEWHQLEPRAAKALVMLWLIASENEGELPEAKTLAFRLRTTERSILDVLGELSHWLEQGDITPISDGHQGDAPETEKSRDKERDRQARAQEFETFYAAYPKHEGRAPAEKAWAKVDAPLQSLLDAIKRQSKSANWLKDEGRYIPLPATWLNQRRWEDEGVAIAAPAPRGPDPALAKIKADAAQASAPSLETLAKLAELRKPKEAH